MIKVPSSIKVSTYPWPNASVYQRFNRIVNRTSGALYLGELADMLRQAGVPQEALESNPRSVYRPDMLVGPLEEFFHPPVVAMDDSRYNEALERVRSKFRLNRAVKPISLEAALERMDHTTNAGLPTLGKKADDTEALSRAKHCLKGKCPPPMVVYHRGKNLVEARPVQCLPFEWHLVEATYFYPMQDALMKFRSPYTAGRTRTEIASSMNSVAYDASGWLCLDYSGFDRSVSARLLSDAFRIVRDNMQLTRPQHVVLDRIVTYFATGPMLLPDGNVYSGRRHGVPSGSMFTQLIDSIVNAIAIEYLRARSDIRILKYWVVGDDSVIAIAGQKAGIVKVKSILGELGLQVNSFKSSYKEKLSDVDFLGHKMRAKAIRDPNETFQRIVNPERFHPAFHAESKDDRYARYAEIIRGHMVDNVAAFPYLERVLGYLEGWTEEIRPVSKVSVNFYPRSLYTRALKTDIARTRWDAPFRSALQQPTNGPALGALVFY